jgi:hypothetical protein
MHETPSVNVTVTAQKFDSSVCIATRYGLDGQGIEFRCWARFSAPVQTGPGAHLSSCAMGTGSLSGTASIVYIFPSFWILFGTGEVHKRFSLFWDVTQRS